MVPVSGNVHAHRVPPPVSAVDLHRATTSELPGEPLGFHGPAPVQQEETFSVAAFVREVARYSRIKLKSDTHCRLNIYDINILISQESSPRRSKSSSPWETAEGSCQGGR